MKIEESLRILWEEKTFLTSEIIIIINQPLGYEPDYLCEGFFIRINIMVSWNSYATTN